MPHRLHYLPAILWVLLSTALFTLIFASAKFADGTIGTFQITMLRYIGAFGTALLLVQVKGGRRQYRSRQPHVHFLRATFGCSGAVAITWASANMPIADATAIGMLYGVLAIILGVMFLNERVGALHWTAVTMSVAGVVVVMLGKGAFQGALPLWPTLVALLSALLLASEGLLISVLGRAENALTVMLHVNFFGICLMLWPAYAEWQPISPLPALACLLLGPLAIVAQYCTIRGYRSAPLSVVGPVDYSWLIFAALLGLLVFGERPDSNTLLGGALILCGGLLLARVKTEAT